MPYDSTLDKQLFAKSWENDDSKITVSVYSYNNGPKKIQISRETCDAEGNYRFGKLGRLTKDEVAGILPLLNEAVSQL